MNRGLVVASALAGLLAAYVLVTRPETPPVPPPPKPQRIVPLSFAACEMLLELVPRERIAAMPADVATSPYSAIRDRVAGIRMLGPDSESLVALAPDLVLTAPYVDRQKVRPLELSRIAYHQFTDFTDLESIFGAVLTLGDLVGEPDRARELVARCRADVAALRRRIPKGAPAPRAVTLSSDGTTSGSRTTIHSILLLAGARNLAAEAGIEGFGVVSAEQVIAWRPDVLVVGVGLGQQIQSEAAWAPLRTCRIIEIPLPYFTSVSHHAVEALRQLVAELYP